MRGLHAGDIVIDCGANVGDFTRLLADTGATVYAFEPDPYCFGILEQTFANRSNVHLSNCAVGIENAKVELYRANNFEEDPNKLSKSSSLYGSKGNIDNSSSVTVQQLDLVEFIKNLPSVALLKVDVEGAEVPIIEKLLDTGVIDKIGSMFVETHERNIPELADRTLALRGRVAQERRRNINLDWR